MKTTMWVVCVMVAALLGAPGASRADVLKAAPVEAVLLPDEGDGAIRVAFLFDLSGLRSGENRRIDEALLDWWLTGTSEEAVSEFTAYPVAESWTETSVAQGTAPDLQEQRAATWDVFPTAPERGGERLVRLDLTELVNAWAAGATANHGVVVTTAGLSRATAGAQLAKATLTIRYGFRSH